MHKIIKGDLQGKNIEIEGLFEDVSGCSWMYQIENMACIEYAIRGAKYNLPTDNKVYYGKINGRGYLVHESEITEIKKEIRNG
jgi:hypothetical protein